MDEEQIWSLVRRSAVLEASFKGVFKRDGLKFLGENIPGGCYVLNSSNALPGDHWVALYKERFAAPPAFALFFDSLGRAPSFYDIIFPRHAVLYNEEQFQASGSASCGLFCIYFLYQKTVAGRSFSAIVSDFHADDLVKNEQLIAVFSQSLLDGQLQ